MTGFANIMRPMAKPMDRIELPKGTWTLHRVPTDGARRRRMARRQADRSGGNWPYSWAVALVIVSGVVAPAGPGASTQKSPPLFPP